LPLTTCPIFEFAATVVTPPLELVSPWLSNPNIRLSKTAWKALS
jgi:hypothetical protein